MKSWKKVLAFFGGVFVAVGIILLCNIAPANADGLGVVTSYGPLNLFPATSVSDTPTAGGFTLLAGSTQPQYDLSNNKARAISFMIQAFDASMNPVDFYWAYSKNPTAPQPCKETYFGPMERSHTVPTTGIYVAPAFTTPGTITVYFEPLE